MNTPSEEALKAARDLFKQRYCFASDNVAPIIDCHFEPLRQRAEQAEARVKELEFGLKHQCETCEMKSIFDGEHAYALKMQARVKELEATCAELVTDGNALTLAANLAKQSQRAEQAEARVKELQKQEAESRRLFYAEQDKRQSAEFRCEELAGALREIATYDTQRAAVNGCAYAIISIAVNILARHAAGDPEAQK